MLAHDKFGGQDEEKEVNISSTSTLIIGKNNVGKTSVISAIKKILDDDSFKATDFNFNYFKKILDSYDSESNDIVLPEISFSLNMKLDDEDAIISNIAPLLFLNEREYASVHIKIELEEAEEFKSKVNELLEYSSEKQFKLLLDAIDEVGLQTIYLNEDKQEISGFKLKNLIELNSIEANKITQDNSLTKAFNKIIE